MHKGILEQGHPLHLLWGSFAKETYNLKETRAFLKRVILLIFFGGPLVHFGRALVQKTASLLHKSSTKKGHFRKRDLELYKRETVSSHTHTKQGPSVSRSLAPTCTVRTNTSPRLECKASSFLFHQSKRLLPLSGVSGLVVVVEAARGGNVLAPSLVRCPVAFFASSVAANMALKYLAYIVACSPIFCVFPVMATSVFC